MSRSKERKPPVKTSNEINRKSGVGFSSVRDYIELQH